jgi:hypothetical protein
VTNIGSDRAQLANMALVQRKSSASKSSKPGEKLTHHYTNGRETVEHPFGTMKARMGATHFLTKTLPKVAAEMALSVLAYNLTRVMNIVGIKPLIDAIVV